MRKRTWWRGQLTRACPFSPRPPVFVVLSSATVSGARTPDRVPPPPRRVGGLVAPLTYRSRLGVLMGSLTRPRARTRSLAIGWRWHPHIAGPPPTLLGGCGCDWRRWRGPACAPADVVLFRRRPRRSEGLGSCKKEPRTGSRAQRRCSAHSPWGAQRSLHFVPRALAVCARTTAPSVPLGVHFGVGTLSRAPDVAHSAPPPCFPSFCGTFVSTIYAAVTPLPPPSPSCWPVELHLRDRRTLTRLTLGGARMASVARFRRLAATASAAGLLFSLVGGAHAAGGKVAPDADLSELLGVGLVVAQLVFHVLLHQLEHFVGHKHPSLLPVLRTLYRELLILGFVSFTFIMVATFGKVSQKLFVSFEFAHFLIFLLAVFYIFVVFATSWASLSLSARWRKIESMEFVEYLAFKQEYTELKAEREQHSNYVWRWCLWWKGNPFKLERYHFLHERMAFHDSRFQFLYYRGLPEDFSFSAYLRKVKSQVRCRFGRERGVGRGVPFGRQHCAFVRPMRQPRALRSVHPADKLTTVWRLTFVWLRFSGACLFHFSRRVSCLTGLPQLGRGALDCLVRPARLHCW